MLESAYFAKTNGFSPTGVSDMILIDTGSLSLETLSASCSVKKSFI